MRTDGIMVVTKEVKAPSYPGEWPSGKATDFELVARFRKDNGKSMNASRTRIATGVDWVFASEWLTLDEACFLTGHDRSYMLQAIEAGCADLKDADELLIQKRSLWEYQQVLVELAHWVD